MQWYEAARHAQWESLQDVRLIFPHADAVTVGSGRTVTVGYTLGGGTATAGSDYDATPGTVTFTPGILRRDLLVPIFGDGAAEGNEDFLVTLGSPAGATISSGTGRMIIKDDDTPSPRSGRPSTKRPH